MEWKENHPTLMEALQMLDDARGEIYSKGTITFAEPQNPWKRISEVAARVGVGPYEGKECTITALGADGKDYDLWEVIIAVLDRLNR